MQETRLAPTQTRIIPIRLSQEGPFLGSEINLVLVGVSSTGTSMDITITLPVNHHQLWDSTEFHPIVSSYFFATSMPAAFLSIPPKQPNQDKPQTPLLALRASKLNLSNLLTAKRNCILTGRWGRGRYSIAACLGLSPAAAKSKLGACPNWENRMGIRLYSTPTQVPDLAPYISGSGLAWSKRIRCLVNSGCPCSHSSSLLFLASMEFSWRLKSTPHGSFQRWSRHLVHGFKIS